MSPENRNEDIITSDKCEKCYNSIIRELDAVWDNIKWLKASIWIILILLIGNLAGVITILVRGGAA